MEFKRIVGLCGIALLAGFFAAGCSSKEESPAEGPNLDGLWLLSITQEFGRADYRDVSTVLLRIKQDGGDYQVKIEGNKPALPDPVLKQFDVSGNKIKLVLTSDQYTYDFEGVIQGSVIRGNMDQGRLIIEPAQLERTQIVDIAEAIDFPVTDRNLEYQVLVETASGDKSDSVSLADHYKTFRDFCAKHARTPLAVILSHKLASALSEKAQSEAEVKAFAKQYLGRAALWGERMEMRARFNLGRSLAEKPEFAELGLAYLDKAESQMDAPRREELKQELATIRQMVEDDKVRSQASKAFALAKSGDRKGLERLRTLNEESPFDPAVIYQRAEAARLLGETEEALRLNARLATWPRLQAALQQEPIWQAGERKLPDGVLMEMYARRHEGLEGLGEYQNKIYAEAVSTLADQLDRPKTGPKGDRISVVELFTGAGCVPCVAADLATAALEKVYSPSHLIVLRYHLHSAGFDPLAHPHNIERFQDLLGPEREDQLATPTVFINGKRAEFNVGGSLKDAVQIGSDLQNELLPVLEESSPLKFELSAIQQDDEITVSAKLAGAAGDQKDKLRVFLILVEEQVDFAARNGIRRHEMLARWFANEARGIEFSSAGDFTYTEQTYLSEIRDFLKSSNRSAAEVLDVEPESAPLLLEDLRLVGLVQHAGTGEILQAALVPVKVENSAVPGFNEPLKQPAAGPTFGPKPPESETDPAPAEKPEDAEPIKNAPKAEGPKLVLPKLP